MIQKAPRWCCYRGVKCLLWCPSQRILLFHVYLPNADQEQEEKQRWSTPYNSIALWLVHREVRPIDSNVAIPKTQDHQLLPVCRDNRLPSWLGGQHATRTRKHRFDVLDACGKQRPRRTDSPIILRRCVEDKNFIMAGHQKVTLDRLYCNGVVHLRFLDGTDPAFEAGNITKKQDVHEITSFGEAVGLESLRGVKRVCLDAGAIEHFSKALTGRLADRHGAEVEGRGSGLGEEEEALLDKGERRGRGDSGAVERAVLGEDADAAAGVAGEHVARPAGVVGLEVHDRGGVEAADEEAGGGGGEGEPVVAVRGRLDEAVRGDGAVGVAGEEQAVGAARRKVGEERGDAALAAGGGGLELEQRVARGGEDEDPAAGVPDGEVLGEPFGVLVRQRGRRRNVGALPKTRGRREVEALGPDGATLGDRHTLRGAPRGLGRRSRRLLRRGSEREEEEEGSDAVGHGCQRW
uniref:Uncharacterized protein n=1 Tax=Zea mays TaxID=4577 RepID=A0A804PVE1_MAIZE